MTRFPALANTITDPYVMSKRLSVAHVEAIAINDAMTEYRYVMNMTPEKLLMAFALNSRVVS